MRAGPTGPWAFHPDDVKVKVGKGDGHFKSGDEGFEGVHVRNAI